MPVVHLICSDVPSSGKSFIAWQLAMHMMYNSQPLKIFDLDPEKVISSFNGFTTFHFNVVDFDYSELFKKVLSSKTDILIDSTYKQFDTLMNYLEADNSKLLSLFSESNLKLVLHLPVCGGATKEQCIKTVNSVLERFTSTNVVAWLNHYPVSVINEVKPTNDVFYNLFSDQGTLRFVVNLPRFCDSKTVTDDTCNYFLNSLWKERKIYGQLLDTEHFAEACNPYLDNRPFVMIMAQRVGYIRDVFDEAIAPLSEIIF